MVNLLPVEIRESIFLSKVFRAGMLAAIVLMAIATLIWLVQAPAINSSSAALADAQAANAHEQAQVQALSPIAQMLNQITSQKKLVVTTLASQPKAAAISRRLLAAAASTGSPAITFDTISVTYSGIPNGRPVANPCPNPDPFSSPVAIGCIVFSASAGTREQVSRLLTALGRDSLFIGPYVGNSTLAAPGVGSRQSVAFSGTVGISLGGLSTPLSSAQRKALQAAATATPGTGLAATKAGA
ncbi:MAG: hypothetical protein Q7L55_05810 [Actinomycetota bacterium]|nr:hypothetical protein [Actinomycetota bacterium]